MWYRNDAGLIDVDDDYAAKQLRGNFMEPKIIKTAAAAMHGHMHLTFEDGTMLVVPRPGNLAKHPVHGIITTVYDDLPKPGDTWPPEPEAPAMEPPVPEFPPAPEPAPE